MEKLKLITVTTLPEVLKYIENHIDLKDKADEEYERVINTVKHEIMVSTPKKVLYVTKEEHGVLRGFCPSCGRVVNSNYCPECRQALDWNMEE